MGDKWLFLHSIHFGYHFIQHHNFTWIYFSSLLRLLTVYVIMYYLHIFFSLWMILIRVIRREGRKKKDFRFWVQGGKNYPKLTNILWTNVTVIDLFEKKKEIFFYLNRLYRLFYFQEKTRKTVSFYLSNFWNDVEFLSLIKNAIKEGWTDNFPMHFFTLTDILIY